MQNEPTNQSESPMKNNDQNDPTNPEPAKDARLKDENYQLVPNVLVNEVRDGSIEPLDVLVYMVFANHQGKKRSSWPSCNRVATMLGKTTRTVNRCIKRLVEAGHLVRRSKTKSGTRFTYLKTRVSCGKVIRDDPIQPIDVAVEKAAFNEYESGITDVPAARSENESSDDLSIEFDEFGKARHNWNSRQPEPENEQLPPDLDDVPF